MQTIENFLHQLGFTHSFDVTGRASVADLFKRRRRCGIYTLHFANGDYYVGQAVDVVRRYAQHRHQHTDIVKISFKPVGKRRLNLEEQAAVKALEQAGFFLRNIQLVTFSHSETDFDLIMPRDEQDRWLADMNYHDLGGERAKHSDLRRKYATRFSQFEQMPLADDVITVLREYILWSVPAVKRGEVSFWMVSCLPGSQKDLYARVNLGWQTAFEVFVVEEQPQFIWYLTRSLLETALQQPLNEIGDGLVFGGTREDEFGFEVYRARLKQGGLDQVVLATWNADNAIDLIQDVDLLPAIRRFNLGLMQKNPCPWGRSHCPQLADRLIG